MEFAKAVNNMFLSIVIATMIVSAISLIGAVLLFVKKDARKTVVRYFVSFAAGVILSTAILDLFPEAVAYGDRFSIDIYYFVLIGMVGSFFVERFLTWFHHQYSDKKLHPTAMLVLVGDGFHNFIDGVIIAASFTAGYGIGITTTIAIAAHEIPHEIGDFAVLINSGMKKNTALLLNFLSALTALLGAIVGYFWLQSTAFLLAPVLAIGAGVFIYLATADLIPELHREFALKKNWYSTLAFIFGIILTALFIKIGA